MRNLKELETISEEIKNKNEENNKEIQNIENKENIEKESNNLNDKTNDTKNEEFKKEEEIKKDIKDDSKEEESIKEFKKEIEIYNDKSIKLFKKLCLISVNEQCNSSNSDTSNINVNEEISNYNNEIQKNLNDLLFEHFNKVKSFIEYFYSNFDKFIVPFKMGRTLRRYSISA